MVEDSVGDSPPSEEGRDIRKWGKYTIVVSIVLGLFGLYWIGSFPDVVDDEFDYSFLDYQEACEEAIHGYLN